MLSASPEPDRTTRSGPSHRPDPAALFRGIRVLPILTLEDPERAVRVARALAEGGLRVIEITLRTPRALAAIEAIAAAAPETVVGAGTVRSRDDLRAAADAGARFAVSPGTTPALLEAAAAGPLPLVPGVATASEAMLAAEAGIRLLKLFPAEAIGGIELLRALAGPLPELRFCPTGGIRPERIGAYLELPNVVCVGGSWVAPPAAVAAEDWDAVRRLAQEASGPSSGRTR